jgi:hypothetical protein
MRIISRAPPAASPADQSLVWLVGHQPDGVAGCSGATTLTLGELHGVIQVVGWATPL